MFPKRSLENILFLLCFLLLLRFSVSAENLIVILKVFLYYYYYYYFSFFLQILCRQVLGDAWFDVRQIFRDDRYWLEVYREFKIFSYVNYYVRYWRFNDFQRGALSASVLRNYRSYELEIFRNCKGGIIDMHNGIQMF